MPDPMSPDPEVVALTQDDIGCQYCWADPRYTKIADDKARRCPVCGADYTGPRRPSLVPFTHAAGYRVVAEGDAEDDITARRFTRWFLMRDRGQQIAFIEGVAPSLDDLMTVETANYPRRRTHRGGTP